MVYRWRVVVALVVVGMMVLGSAAVLFSGFAMSVEPSVVGPQGADTGDPALMEAVKIAMPGTDDDTVRVFDVVPGMKLTNESARKGAVYTLRAVCAGTGSITMRLTDGVSSAQTRLTCSPRATERRSIQLTVASGVLTQEFDPDDGAGGVVGSQLIDGPLPTIGQ